MNPIIELKLDKVQRQWNWLRLGQHAGTVGAILCLVWFLIQWSVWREIVTNSVTFILLTVVFVLGAILSFLILAFYHLTHSSKRSWKAGVVEKSNPDLMDRINTMVYLEENKIFSRNALLPQKIQKQAADILTKKRDAYPFSPAQTWLHLGFFALVLAAVISFQIRYAPFAKLKSGVDPVAPAKPDSLFELKAGDSVETAGKKSWGEVRIVEPGRDLKMTKVDVIPLQIEMTASEALEKPAWITSLNGGPENRHELDAPKEPNYAAYQPILYLDELKVSDWDVVSYFGRVESCAPAQYTSKIYFIEIRPFRDDILKMSGKGGEGGKGYELLNELSGLIKRQTEILQDTHQHQQINYPKEELRDQDRKKLAGAEEDLGSATDQLYAKIASEQENTPVGDILDHLAAGNQHMDKGAEALRDDAVPEGKQREQKALAELIATRKTFQKTMAENPGAFGGGGGDDPEESEPTVNDSRKALEQVSEMKDREQAALDEMKLLAQQQQALADIARNRLSQEEGSNTTAKAQTDLKDKLERLIKENPDLFRGTGNEQEAVKKNMDRAIQSLSTQNWSSQRYLTRSAETLRDLEKAVSQNHEREQLAQAYELKKIIDQNIRQLGAEESKPGTLTNEEAKALADSAKRSTGALKEITESSGGAGMGEELKKSLSGENQEALAKALEKFSESPSKEGRQAGAGEAGQGLAKVSQAFDQSRPDLTKLVRGKDSLGGKSEGDAMGQAQQQLQSMLTAQQQNRPFPPEIESKALADILRLLKMEEQDAKKTDPDHAVMVAKVEAMLEKKKGLPMDADALKKLMDEIEAVRIEVKDRPGEQAPDEVSTQVDPSKFPPSYRERIKRYFEQLSATPP